MFERLRAAIDAALAAATPAQDLRDLAGQMRKAVIELKAAVGKMRDDLAATERQLEPERRSLSDAQRRGRLAEGISDHETVEVARRFAVKHAERISVLEQKLSAQRAELALAERELSEMTDRLRSVERERPPGSPGSPTEQAWRDIQAAGGARPETDLADELLKGSIDRQAREAAAEAQLRELKKKMGK
ncbi:MAG: hypothetical protein HY700_13265 [Gemmatimonadetes bacterium]|nr:hypothetical protein [Gemmatimonadota bacterium]